MAQAESHPMPDFIHLVLETALLSAKKPLAVRDMRRLFDDRYSAKEIKAALTELQTLWQERGLRLVELGTGWRFQTAPEMARYLSRLEEEKPVRYSRAALEVLAIIAYRQPVTRGDIEEIRGVALNTNVLRQFEERGWVETLGYRETPGRPALLGTTRQFLNDLGLKSLNELPAIPDNPEPEFPLADLGSLFDEEAEPADDESVPEEDAADELALLPKETEKNENQ